MRFKAEVLAGIGEVLISIRLLVASCQTIRTPIRTNQATSCSPPPPFLFAFYLPTPLIDVDRCLCLQLSKLCKNVENVGLIFLLQPVSPRQDNTWTLPLDTDPVVILQRLQIKRQKSYPEWPSSALLYSDKNKWQVSPFNYILL